MRNFQLPGRSTAHALHGLAATSSPLASLEAVAVLRAGGNAVDAAVTAAAVLCITEPHMTGIGGDCFALIGHGDGTVHGLNASGRSAMAADGDWLKRAKLDGIDPDSAHAITVPGAVDGWQTLLDRFGTMTLAQALEPAIRLAETGAPVLPRVAFDWAQTAERLDADEGGRLHLLPRGRAPRAGEVMRYPALAKSLRLIAKQGRDGFYGDIAKDIVDYIKPQGSLLTLDDFARTKAEWVEPISMVMAAHEIIELPPNGQGVTALIAINVLRNLDLQAHAPDSAERIHLESEAMRLAWLYRNRHVGDSDAIDMATSDLISEKMGKKLAGLVSARRAMGEPEGLPSRPKSDTVYLSVVDKDRLAVSFINSLYYSFGSGRTTPKTGITLQNRGACFVTEPGHPNCIGPGKRPLHTLMPGMIKKGAKISHSFGVMGGAYQPMGHLSVVANRLLYGMDVQEAVDFPRHFPLDGVLWLEAGVRASVAEALERKGHKVARAEEPLGGGQMIEIDKETGTLAGGSDSRKDGLALGY
ncbi:MAG TPA: gamma-glutamyltransferase family protein [Aestuariivirgaceae bacterium]